MDKHSVIFTVFVIFTGAAVFSILALYLRQSLLIAYMLFGVVFGPWGLRLHPQSLLRMIGKTAWITFISSSIFFVVGFTIGYWYGYSLAENLIIGACVMFSSTIVSLKFLHFDGSDNQRTNGIMVGILLLQDLIAIIVLIGINIASHGKLSVAEIALVVLALPSIVLFVFLIERYILSKIFARFTEIREYTLLIVIFWCLGVSELAKVVGLSYEIGAFIAVISIAASPIALYVAEQFKPIRDFFLVLFFFVIGASFNLHYLNVIFVPTLIFTFVFMVLKPVVFSLLLCMVNETKSLS